MTPLKLSITGINSFMQKEEVDFTSLARDNIFCISGATGSGKTTILDCIIIALYGVNSRGNQSECINLNLDKGEVIFSFVFEDVSYEVKRILFRKSAAKSELKNLTSNEIISSLSGEVNDFLLKLIGLSREDFCQVVLLEQGKINAFLTSSNAERSATVARIFSLDRFGNLVTTFNSLMERFKSETEKLDIKLSALQMYNKEALMTNKENEKALDKSRNELFLNLKDLEKQSVGQALKCEKSLMINKAKGQLVTLEGQLNTLNVKLKVVNEKSAEFTLKNITENSLYKIVLDSQNTMEKVKKLYTIQMDIEKKNLALESMRGEYILIKNGIEKLEKTMLEYSQILKLCSLEECKDTYEHMMKNNALAGILEGLREGDDCPVCGNKIEMLKRADLSDIEKIKKEIARLTIVQQDLDKAAIELQNKKSKYEIAISEGKNLSEQVKLLTNNITEVVGDKPLSQMEKELITQKSNAEKDLEILKNLNQNMLELKTDITTMNFAINEIKVQIAEYGDADYDPETDKNLQIKIRENKEQTEKVSKDLYETQKFLSEASGKIEEAENLKTLKKEYEKKLNSAQTLRDLCKDKKFLNYVSNEYIEEFTFDASNRLFELTNGKYELQYVLNNDKKDSGFWVKDYTSGGETRKITTLSGGETFLASVSLAIAIAKMVAKNKSYDFFFLDEGFGTLDEQSIDTVVDALKKLSENTLVGVVSHRVELLERIEKRVVVKGAGGGEGSRISEEG